jgi:site-specific DNA recombinase
MSLNLVWMMLAGVYGRISDNPDQDELGVRRQIKDGRELVGARGGTVVAELVDNDVSAFSGAHRPGYEALIALAEDGKINTIVVWQLSRLWRNRSERADGITRLAKLGITILAVKGPGLDLSNAYGRGMAGILGEFDTMESEVKSERVLRKMQELAEAGAISGGGRRPFGYRRVFAGKGPGQKILRDELHPVEAPIVRKLVNQLLDGETLWSLEGWAAEQGIRNSVGGEFRRTGIRRILWSARIAGLREHHGRTYPAVWPAIITVEEHQQIRALLARTSTRGAIWPARNHYATGLVYCTGCIEQGAGRMQVGSGTLRYRCHTRGCGRTIQRGPLEAMIAKYVVNQLNADEFLSLLVSRERSDDTVAQSLQRKIADDERRIEAIGAALEDADIDTIPEVIASLTAVRRRIEETRGQIADLASVPKAVREAVGLTVEAFEKMDLGRKRVLTSFWVGKVLIGQGRRGPNQFDPRRVHIQPPGRQHGGRS